MADFMAELSQNPSHPVESPGEGWWTLHVDKASRASSSRVEYETDLARLDLVLTLAIAKLEICNDSQLIDEHMAHYLTMVGDHLKKLDEWMIRRVPQKKNLKVDAMARITTTLPIREVVMLPIYLQVSPSITPEQVFNLVEANLSWMHDIVKSFGWKNY
ncbi:hypothetical protein AAG906_012612 [Vitis piasezkii]